MAKQETNKINLLGVQNTKFGEMPPKSEKKETKRCGFVLKQRLGKGTYGVVFEAVDPAGRVVALKVPREKSSSNLIEATLQATLEHPNLIHTVYVDYDCREEDWIDIGMEKAAQSLFQWEQNNRPSLETLAMRILLLKDVQCGLDFLTVNRVAHLDLKPDNVLLVYIEALKRFVAKLSDFGLSERITKALPDTPIKGTLDYMAPELLCRPRAEGYSREYAFEYDAWSLGVLAFELIFGLLPFSSPSDDTETEVFVKIVAKLGAPYPAWTTKFGGCPLTESDLKGRRTLDSILGHARYALFTKEYGPDIMRALERFFMRIFIWAPEDRIVDLIRLREDINQHLPKSAPKVPAFAKCPVPKQRLTGTLDDYKKEEKKSHINTPWLVAFLDTLPDDIHFHFVAAWNRVKEARRLDPESEPTFAETIALVSLVSRLIGIKRTPLYEPLIESMQDIDVGSLIDSMEHKLLDDLCFNVDGDPWKCNVLKLPNKKKKKKKKNTRTSARGTRAAPAARARYSATVPERSTSDSIAARVKAHRRSQTKSKR